MYIAASINLVGQREKLTGQMPKLAGKCHVTDCYYEHWSDSDLLETAFTFLGVSPKLFNPEPIDRNNCESHLQQNIL